MGPFCRALSLAPGVSGLLSNRLGPDHDSPRLINDNYLSA
jgi:hypothetical protein